MKTENLIAALVADGASIRTPIAHKVALAMACGFALSAAVFFWQLGWRPDIGEARGTLPFLFKFVVTLALLVPAALLVARLARPDAAPGLWGWALLIAPLLLVAGSSAELIASPTNVWTTKLIGAHAAACVTLILLLSIVRLRCRREHPRSRASRVRLPESQLVRWRQRFTPCIARTIARSSSRLGTPLRLA